LIRESLATNDGLPLIVTRDSADGGLALSLLVRLRELREPMPTAAILLSPWTDLSASGASVVRSLSSRSDFVVHAS
jgi:acetyl esterase/lipase